MKNIRFYLLGTVVFLGILLDACFKPIYEDVYIGQEARDYYMFKEGSYWIYQDSITNNTDSVVLMQTLLEYVEKHEGEWKGVIRKKEFYTGECYHYLSDTTISRSYRIEQELSTCFPIIVFNLGIQYLEKNIDLCIFVADRYAQTSHLPSYSIGKNIFNDVRVIWTKNIIIEGKISDYSIKCYWVRSIGLIRYELYNSNEEILNTYNLVKYNVKPYKQ